MAERWSQTRIGLVMLALAAAAALFVGSVAHTSANTRAVGGYGLPPGTSGPLKAVRLVGSHTLRVRHNAVTVLCRVDGGADICVVALVQARRARAAARRQSLLGAGQSRVTANPVPVTVRLNRFGRRALRRAKGRLPVTVGLQARGSGTVVVATASSVLLSPRRHARR